MEIITNDIENRFLSAIVDNGDAGTLDLIFDMVEYKHFYKEKNAQKYNKLREIYQEYGKVNIEYAHSKIGADFVTELQFDISATELTQLAKHIIYLYSKKKSLDISTYISDMYKKGEGVDEILEGVKNKIESIDSVYGKLPVDMNETARQLIERLKEVEAGGRYGYSWGMQDLDWMTGGILPGKLYVIGGTKKTGKTKFVINTIYHLSKQDIKPLFISLEMDRESVMQELVSRFYGIDNRAFFVSNKEHKNLDVHRHNAIKAVESVTDKITLYDNAVLTVNDIEKIIKSHARKGLKIAFVDYLQRMAYVYDKGISMNLASVISTQMIRLAQIAKTYNVTIIILSQLRNDAEGERATIEHLKDSGGIGEAVDCAMILNNLDRIKPEKDLVKDIVEIDVVQRRGRGGIIKCKVDLSRACYYDEHKNPIYDSLYGRSDELPF